MKAEVKQADAALELASYVANTRYEDIPDDVREVTKKSILDTLGITLAASTMGEGCQQVVGLVKEAGGKPEGTIIGAGGKVPSFMAALANGAMGHAMDYGDVHDELGLHASNVTVLPAFAVAELGHVDGKEFITAVAVASDMIYRIARAVYSISSFWDHNWHPTTMLGFFSSAAVSARLLGLNETGVADALGLVFHQAGGTNQIMLAEGAMSREIRDGFSCKAGVLSALLAQRGVTGIRDWLESRFGLYNAYFRGSYNRDLLVGDLGKRYENTGVSYKPWPACRGTHHHIDALLQILSEHDIPAQDIAAINLTVGSFARDLCGTGEHRRKPKTVTVAKESLPFTIAVAALRRKVVISDFTAEGLKDPAVLAIAEKVAWDYKPEFDAFPHPGIVEVKTKNGQVFTKRVEFARGHPKNPVSTEEVVQKFRDCAAYSASRIAKKDVERVIDMVDHLEQVEDVNQIVRLLG